MTDPDPARPPSSAAIHARFSKSPSPQPSIASRTSRSSLRRQYVRPTTPSVSTSAPPQPQQEQTTETAPEQPSFSPLFALLSSTAHPSQKQTLHHPAVHYIFADDDPEMLTEALARHHRAVSELDEGGDPPEAADDEDDGPDTTTAASLDRAIVLDVVPSEDGTGSFEVAWASSLTPDWAVVSASLSRMDEGDERPSSSQPKKPQQEQERRRGGSFVLKIEGVTVEAWASPNLATAGTVPPGKASPLEGELQSSGASGASKSQQKPPSEEYPALMDEFEKRMGVLRQVVEAGDERQRKVEADADPGNEEADMEGKGDESTAPGAER